MEQKLKNHRNRDILHVFNTFLQNETMSGILLLICAAFAVIMATVPGGGWFDDIWDNEAGFTLGEFSIHMSLRLWINDALMAIFFFVVGLEIKREMLVGQLSSFKRAILPVTAAIGGMIVPALIYTAFNYDNPDSANGWGIPMATDIAFAIGILALLGKRVPGGLKIFLTALAIADDLGAILVLAIFYPIHDIQTTWLLYVAIILAVMFIFNRTGLKNKYLYIIPGIILWYCMYKSGIHATISGVLTAMMIPSKGTINELRFHTKIAFLLKKFRLTSTREVHVLTSPEQQHIIHRMHQEIYAVDPLLHRFEHRLHPVVTFFIMPLFALANAGVALDFGTFASQGIPDVSLGIFFGLLFGKPIGIFLFSFIGIKCGFAAKPAGVSWLQLAAIGVLGGIGFTMSIFVDNLAFASQAIIDTGKISILLTSATAAVLGLTALALTCKGTAPALTPEQILPEKRQKKRPKLQRMK